MGAGRARADQHRIGLVVAAAMKSDGGTLALLAGHFALLSLFAIGGANAAVPEMHRLAVEVMHWMDDRQFADMFAIAQLAPGPNVIVVTLIGYHVAGVTGALITTAAMCGPTCLFAYFVGGVWRRFKDAPWRIAIQAGLVPLSIGLIAASAFVLARAADQTWLAVGITVATAALAHFTRINPLWMFGAAAAFGLLGFV
jgi:chromate transporter